MFIGNSWKLQTWQWTTYHKLQKRFLEMCKRNFESEKENGIFIFLFLVPEFYLRCLKKIS